MSNSISGGAGAAERAEYAGAGGAGASTTGEFAAEPRQMYTCRMCRRVVFSDKDLENHQTAQHGFHRRKSKGVTSTGVCSSFFLAEPPLWMEKQARKVEGKLSCPNKSCGARLGSLKWTGAQCSCGSWVTPAIQFPKKNLDIRSITPAGAPPGTVVHPSLLTSTRGHALATGAGAIGDVGGEGYAQQRQEKEQDIVPRASQDKRLRRWWKEMGTW